MIERIGRWFVAPEGPPAARAQPRPAASDVTLSKLAVVCGGPAATAIGAAFALALQRTTRARCALVVRWGVGGGSAAVAAPASSAARALRERLAMRGLDRVAVSGRVVTLQLPEQVDAAVSASRRALAAAEDEASVLLVAGPRTAAVEQLLHEQDLVVVVAARSDPELAPIALASLPVDLPSVGCGIDLGLGARALASAGIGLTPAARTALAAPLAALR
jgi:hypothetical protein